MANLTDILPAPPHNVSGLQLDWANRAQACFRPPADYGIPIICTADPDPTQTGTAGLVSPWVDFGLFESCCPWNSQPGIKNVYTASRFCSTPACFTGNESIARQWPGCVLGVLGRYIEGVKAAGNETNVTMSALDAKCEYIDYERLRQGVKRSEGSLETGRGFWLLFGLVGAVTVLLG